MAPDVRRSLATTNVTTMRTNRQRRENGNPQWQKIAQRLLRKGNGLALRKVCARFVELERPPDLRPADWVALALRHKRKVHAK